MTTPASCYVLFVITRYNLSNFTAGGTPSNATNANATYEQTSPTHQNGDVDGDGTDDVHDNCPQNSLVSRTDFSNFETVALDPHGVTQADPLWIIQDNGTTMRQTLNSDPGLAIGRDNLEGVNFEGTFFVNTRSDDDYIGIVFSYQSNRTFYVVMWKKSQQTYWERSPFTAVAKSGIQVKLVNSIQGPGEWLRNAMWHTGHTKNHVKLLWEDPNQRGWESKVITIFCDP